MENLVFRRQFLLTNKTISLDNNWKKITLNKIHTAYNLYLHPDLNHCEVENERFQLILLGYILDPNNPKNLDIDIVTRLANAKDFDSIISMSYSLNGRYILIYNDQVSLKLFNDATGFREIYYIHSNAIIACGSSPNIISEYYSIPMHDDKEVLGFYHSKEFNSFERVWIGEKTVFKDIYHLLPNHYLDLTKNQIVRFWPKDKREFNDLYDTADQLSKILIGTFESAINRYKLFQGITSGWDTRVLLAASKEHVNNINFYFFRGYKGDSDSKQSIDYLTSKEICANNNIPLEIIEINNTKIDPAFENIFYKNNILARPKLLPVYYDAYIKKLDQTVTVSGTMGNEILRLMSNINRNICDGYKIAKILGYEKYSYVIESVNTWISNSLHLKELNYKLIDLFFWEQYFGNWGALSASEQDIVRDEIRPFNNREFLSTYISLKDKFRHRDYPLGYVKVIEILWKELLNYRMDIPMYGHKTFLRRIGIEILTDKIYQKIKMLFHL